MSAVVLEKVGTWYEAEELANAGRNECPDGWQIIGRGSYRTAYLSPSEVVYKKGTERCNITEHETAVRLREMPPFLNTKIPDTALYECGNGEVIVAMEFIKGVTYMESDLCDCEFKWCEACSKLYYDIEAYYGIDDMHSQNIMVDEHGTMYVIDLGDY